MADLRTFKADLARFADAIEKDLGTVKRRVALDLFGRIIVGTPVDTGRARASWFVADGEPDRITVAPEGRRSPGAATQESFGRVERADLSDPFKAIWITNNLPYIQRLEFGHSRQAPDGWVRQAVADVELQIETLGSILGGT